MNRLDPTSYRFTFDAAAPASYNPRTSNAEKAVGYTYHSSFAQGSLSWIKFRGALQLVLFPWDGRFTGR